MAYSALYHNSFSGIAVHETWHGTSVGGGSLNPSERSDQCHGKFPGERQARDNSPPLANVDALIDYASL